MKKIVILLIACILCTNIIIYAEPAQDKFIGISAGAKHYLLIRDDGTVWAYGENKYGQLGYGGNENQSKPVQVSSLTNVIKVSAGGEFSMALKDDGTVWTWGKNVQGQLGNGSFNDSFEPVCVKDLNDVIDISAGYAHALALKKDGSVWSWGMSNYGQRGDGTSTYKVNIAKKINLDGAISISASGNQSLAALKDGTVWIWGSIEGFKSFSVPDKVMDISDASNVISGGDNVLIIKTDGSVYNLGNNREEQLSDKSDKASSLVKIDGFSNLRSVSLGGGRTVFLTSDGEIWNRGNNKNGELNNGNNENSVDFVRVNGLSDVIEISATINFSLALKADGTVWKWGGNKIEQITKSDIIPPKINVIEDAFDSSVKSYPDIPWKYTKDGSNTGEILFAKNRYISVGGQGIKLSYDLENWKQTYNDSVNAIAENGTVFVAVGYNGLIMTSDDADNWQQQSSPLKNEISDIIWDGKQFIAVGDGDEGFHSGGVIVSEDGKNWSAVNVENGIRFEGIAYNGTMYVLTSWHDVFYSDDAKKWNKVVSDIHFLTPGKVQWLKDRFIITGGGGGNIYYSFDGIEWHRIKQDWDNWMRDCAYNGKIFIAVGMNATIYVSLYGDYWVCKTEWTDTRNSYDNIIWTGNKFIILSGSSILSWVPDDIIKVKVNGKYLIMDTAPVVTEDRTLVPARAISEALGADVIWNEENQTATIRFSDNEIIVKPNEKVAIVNEEEISLDVPAQILNNRIILPIRFIAENLGASVDWDDVLQTIVIDMERIK